MAVNEGWGRRLRDAKRDFEKQHDRRISYREIGERVAAILGRDTVFNPTSVRAWFVEGQEPDTLAAAAAIAQVLETAPGPLAFGEVANETTAETSHRPAVVRGGTVADLAAEQGPAADEEKPPRRA